MPKSITPEEDKDRGFDRTLDEAQHAAAQPEPAPIRRPDWYVDDLLSKFTTQVVILWPDLSRDAHKEKALVVLGLVCATAQDQDDFLLLQRLADNHLGRKS